MKHIPARLFCVGMLVSLSCGTATAQTLFTNVRIFDGKGATLSAPSNVLIKGNTIERISAAPISSIWLTPRGPEPMTSWSAMTSALTSRRTAAMRSGRVRRSMPRQRWTL